MEDTAISKRTWTIEANVAKNRTRIRGWSNKASRKDASELAPSTLGS